MEWVKTVSHIVRMRSLFGCIGRKSICERTYNDRFTVPVCYIISHQRDVTLYNTTSQYGIQLEHTSPLIVTLRNFAKGKDKKKQKGKHTVLIDEKMLAEIIPLDDTKNKMQRAVDHLKEQYIQALSIRSSTGAIENLRISFEGREYFTQELGQVTRKDTKTVIINMVAFPQAIPAVLKAMQKSGMNLNPQQEGTTLFIPVPRVTTEHRAQLAKNAKTLFIQCRDAVKNIQIKYEKELKNSSLAQDIVFNAQQQLGTLAENYIAIADSLLQSKVKELSGKDS